MSEVNQELAARFDQMSKVLEILDENRFRVASYARAARALEALGDDLARIGPDEKALVKIDGIGKGLAALIAEYLRDGRMADYDQLMASIPPGLPALLEIQGLGPKTIALLWKQAGIESVEDLKKKLANDSLADLPGLGSKKLENLRKSLTFAQTAGQRFRINQAMAMAQWAIQELCDKAEGIKRIEYAGSLRRGRETIGDVDLIVACGDEHRGGISEAFRSLEPVTEVLGSGDTKTSVRMGSGIQVDLRLVRPEQFGAALLYFTGSKEHNVKLRERAIRRGMSLNEYGLADRDDPEKLIASEDEPSIYKALQVRWIPPELREGRDEIERAEKGELPELVTVKDIRAELHAHTQASDGRMGLRDLAMLAIDLGYHTLAITDHSRSQVQAHGLDEARLLRHVEAIRSLASELEGQIQLLAGSEVDILADGKLDYPNSLLKQLDIVVASPHAALGQDSKMATSRLLKAIANPYVTILGHPTGRLLTRREGMNPDMRAVLKEAAQRGIAVEINASPWRLDLRDHHARMAIEMGVPLAINTDAHDSNDLDNLYYGVQTARRAGAGKTHVINCLDRKELAKWLASTRA
ncbi:MAG: DNA polymerase/3'-5' exonuclease PolX [Phycisphaeraceae bacterium]|nr:DNA polymerase/3'-5' exonuclease PolX [Phycisphaeraceae bacterium]